MLSKWLDTVKTKFLDHDLPNIGERTELSAIFQPAESHMHYYFSAFNRQILANENIYRLDDLTDFIHQRALFSAHLGEIADAVFQLFESDPQLNALYQHANYHTPLREHLQIGGLYNDVAVQKVVAAFQQTHLPLVIAHFTDNTVLADELLVILNKVQQVFEFAQQENKIVISYLA